MVATRRPKLYQAYEATVLWPCAAIHEIENPSGSEVSIQRPISSATKRFEFQ